MDWRIGGISRKGTMLARIRNNFFRAKRLGAFAGVILILIRFNEL
jgi:hypothetical protein